MDKNFAGQNLNGRSFFGQDLRGADFSGCQLKSCDFTDTDLTDAKFCRATLGDNLHRNSSKLILVSLLSFFSGMTSLLFNFLFIEVATRNFDQVTKNDLLSLGFLFSLSVFLSVYISLKLKNWQIIGMYLLIIIIVGTIVGVLADERTIRIATDAHILLLGAGTISVVSVGSIALATIISIVATMFGKFAVVGAGLGALMGILLEAGSVKEREIATVMTFCLLLFGWH